MPVIRALTIHLDTNPLNPGFEERVRETVENVRRALEKNGINVWTLRLSLPVIDRVDHNVLVETAIRLGEVSSKYNVLVSGFNVDEPSKSIVKGIVDVLSMVEGVYGSFLIDSLEGFQAYVETLYARPGSWKTFTRIALVFPQRILTPYFPASSTVNGREGFSLALRYVDVVKETLVNGDDNLLIRYFKEIEETGRLIEEETGLEYLGTDTSLSPWMEESVGELVEYVNNKPIPEPGTAWAINWLEKHIHNNAVRAGLTMTGFNQVMLAVGEDNLLKERGLEGRLRLRDLALFSAYCVAGLDMAGFSIVRVEKRDLLRLLYDVYTASLVKRRSLGVRLIPSLGEPGSKLEIDRFGIIPVLEY